MSCDYQVKEMENHFNAKRFWSSLNHVDYKFVIIPVVFVFLRIWTEIMNILFLYVQISYDTLPESVTLALLYLSVCCNVLIVCL